MCCDVLRYVAMCCDVLRYVAMYCDMLRCIAIYCDVLRYIWICCDVLPCVVCVLIRMSYVHFAKTQAKKVSTEGKIADLY